MPRFQLDHLESLVAVVDGGSFEAGAATLSITASAVSQRIKAMEQAVGQVLVQRSNPVQATAAGDIVLLHARQVALLSRDTSHALSGGTGEGGRMSLPLAVNADSLATWFLAALAGLPETLGVVVDLRREDQEHTASLLRAGSVMAAVTSTAEAVQGCTSDYLGIMRYRAVCSPAIATTWFTGDRVDDFARAPMVNFDRKDDLQQGFARSVLGFDPRPPRHYVPTSAEFARAIVLGFGWGLLPEQQCLAELGSGALVELAPESPVDVPLYWQRWNLASPLLDELSRAVMATARSSLHTL